MEQSYTLPRGLIYAFVKSLLPEDCYVELHGIADSSDIANEYSGLPKIEKARNMQKIGIINKRGVTTQLTARNFGNLKESTDEKVGRFVNYGFYSPSGEQVIVVIAIPYFFTHSNGMNIFGGFNEYIPQGEGSYEEVAGCISDSVFSKLIPPELILGYYSYSDKDSLYDDVTFVKNPRYYSNLSQEEKDKFIDKYYTSFRYDVNDERHMRGVEFIACTFKPAATTVEQYKTLKSKKRDKI